MNVLSLFDGISCAQIALERLEIKCDNYFASEINEKAIMVTQQNYPNTTQLGCITQINGSEMPKINLLIGGSPCQGFSCAGKGLNFEDPRSKLFFEFVRLKNECEPSYFLLENVYMKEEWRDIISKYIGVEPIEINSNLVSAQNRRRLYWTNIIVDMNLEDKGLVIRDIIEDQPDKYFNWIPDWRTVNRIFRSNSICWDWLSPIRTGQNLTAYYLDKKSSSLGTSGLHILCDNKRIRWMTPIEYERLQTIPDNYTSSLSNAQRCKCLGNSFTVDIIVHLLKNLKRYNNEKYTEKSN